MKVLFNWPVLVCHKPKKKKVVSIDFFPQLLVTHSKTAGIQAEAFMQGDEAGEEGSGSGRNYDNDDTYDDEGSGEEGSGLEGVGKYFFMVLAFG